ncbi:hypothetical protein B0J14DRAFT_577852 [Halenospora varia]|nr:hypothetical protein B0J14DRAFT_577852 [Halenospora varia]
MWKTHLLLLPFLHITTSLAAFQFISPNSTGLVILIGGSYQITWQGSSGLVTLMLVDGLWPDSGPPIATINESNAGWLYSWDPLPKWAGGFYCIRAVDRLGFYYSLPFSLTNSTVSLSSTSTRTLESLGILPSTTSQHTLESSFLTSTIFPTASITPTPPAQTGLSVGAKAGIGAGTSVGIICLFAVAALFFFKQGRRSEALARDSTTTAVSVFEKAELGAGNTQGNEVKEIGERLELKRVRLSELDGTSLQKPFELPDSGR